MMNTIKLKIGQNSISNPVVKSKYTQNINTPEVKNLFGDSKLIDDYFLKGGYKVVSDIDCRNNISCEYRKLGMQVMVVGPDASFKKYVLKGNDPCSNEGWEELITAINEVEVKLVEDYSVLGDSLNTQRDLNLKLKQLVLNLQTQIDNIELTDEKVQITEATNFAQIGQTQKDFNKNISDKFNEKLDKGTYTGTAQDLKNSIDGKADTSHTHNISDVSNLQIALDGKLNKPTTTSNTTSYPYVVGEDGNGNSARLQAGDLGKNFFNSDLSNTTARNHTMNAGVTINTLGNAWNIKGLPNKASDTTNFDNVLRYNPITGQFAYGQAFVYNVPSTITVNNINPPTVADPPTYVSEIQNRLTQLNSVNMQKFTTWNVVTHNNITNNNIRVTNNDTVYTFADAFNSAGIPNETPVISINTEKVLPITSDWAIRFSTFVSHDGSKAVGSLGAIVAKRLIGLFTGNPTSIVAPILFIKDSAYDHINKLLLGAKFILGNSGANTSSAIYTGTNHNNVVQVTILKVNTVILFQVQYLGNTISEIYQASLIGENCGFTVSVVKPDNSFNNSVSVTSSIRYYIFP